MNNTNYNMAVCGTSGAGKTGLIQPLIRSVLDSGGFAVVFDMGDGYKSLCENMGGVYLDGETLRFNPFANITDIDQSAERVRDQLSVMASPNGNWMKCMKVCCCRRSEPLAGQREQSTY